MIGGAWALSPFLHRNPVIPALAWVLDVPRADYEAFATDLRSVGHAPSARPSRQPKNPGVLEEVLATLTPTLFLSGEKELSSMHSANAAVPALMPNAEARVAPGVGHGWSNSRRGCMWPCYAPSSSTSPFSASWSPSPSRGGHLGRAPDVRRHWASRLVDVRPGDLDLCRS